MCSYQALVAGGERDRGPKKVGRKVLKLIPLSQEAPLVPRTVSAHPRRNQVHRRVEGQNIKLIYVPLK